MPDVGAGGEPVGLVLAGGGARGAYELGALSVLLPELERRGERPRVIVGTSAGALNTAYLGATADAPVERVVADGRRIWSEIGFEQVLEPVASTGAVSRFARYLGQLIGVRGARVESLLDSAPLRETLLRVIDFARLEENAARGALHAIGVVATSAFSSRSVVFHRGGAPPEHDAKRGIDYVEVALGDEHVRASAAIPGAFPAVHVASPQAARGWYHDGGTRLNTPIKPALALGAKRVVVVALNSIAPAPPQLADEQRPDALEGASQLIQAVLVDPLVHDLQTLAMVNALLPPAGAKDKQQIPYILIAPQRRDAIGACAQEVFNEHYARFANALRARDLALLGRALAGGSDAAHGELLSYLFFAPEFAQRLLELGADDARRWLAAPHEDGPWELGPPGSN